MVNVRVVIVHIPTCYCWLNSVVGQKMANRTFINQHYSFQLVPQSQWINKLKHKERKQLHPEKQSIPNGVYSEWEYFSVHPHTYSQSLALA